MSSFLIGMILGVLIGIVIEELITDGGEPR